MRLYVLKRRSIVTNVFKNFDSFQYFESAIRDIRNLHGQATLIITQESEIDDNSSVIFINILKANGEVDDSYSYCIERIDVKDEV